MSEQLAPTTASISAQALTLVSREIRTRQETANRTQASNRRSAIKDQSETEAVQKQQERLSERVDQLVKRKKAVSSRISSETVSPPQRTVLVGRANDLQRQVNELDGIVGGEGQGELSSASVLSPRPQATAATALRPQAAAVRRPQVNRAMLKPETTATPSALRSTAAQQQPAAGALRAFAKNVPAAQPATLDLAAASSQVDLIA